MRLSDIPEVAVLHMRTLPTAIARIGNPYLSDLYEKLLPDICLVATKNKQIIGVITATTNLPNTKKRMFRLLFKPNNTIAILTAVCTGRIRAAELFERVTTGHLYPTILTLFVDTNHQRHGIGRKLLSTLEKTMQGKQLYVDTEITNTNARRFYTSRGFRFLKTIHNTVIMVKTLTPAESRNIVG